MYKLTYRRRRRRSSSFGNKKRRRTCVQSRERLVCMFSNLEFNAFWTVIQDVIQKFASNRPLLPRMHAKSAEKHRVKARFIHKELPHSMLGNVYAFQKFHDVSYA